MSRNIAYIITFEGSSDLEKQKVDILEYAKKNSLKLDQIYETEVSLKGNKKDREIIELMETLQVNDIILFTEIAQVGRNMLQVLNIIEKLNDRKIKIVFVNQPELSTFGRTREDILAIYGYFARLEREFISTRTKQGLQALKDRGVKLGRPKGFAKSKLDPYEAEIKALLDNGATKVFIAGRYNTTVGNLQHFINKINAKLSPALIPPA